MTLKMFGRVVVALFFAVCCLAGWQLGGALAKTRAVVPSSPPEDVLGPSVMHVDADAVTLDIGDLEGEQLLAAAILGTDGVAVRWEDGPETCAPIGGMDILVGDEVFRLWWCNLPNGVQFDWQNIERDDCARDGVITLGAE